LSATPYNPLEKVNLAQSIVGALFEQPARPLSDTVALIGAGVYAIYYTGALELYHPISELNKNGRFRQPIYVGKAIPKGGRKGGLGKDAGIGDALRSRLRIHAGSIAEASNLNIDDFWYRALVVDDVWIPLGENAVIEWFRPVWNLALDGFGIKVPGKGRLGQRSSDWDTLHPGRSLAKGLALSNPAVDVLEQRIIAFLAGKPTEINVLVEPDETQDDG
jgi:hypothetical protein